MLSPRRERYFLNFRPNLRGFWGPSWGPPVASCSPLGALLGTFRDPLGPLLGRLGALLGRHGALLGRRAL